MNKPIINVADAPTRSASSGEHFAYSMTELAHPIGARAVVGYPDSRKSGVRIAISNDPGARFIIAETAKNQLGYWEGEDGAQVAAIVGQRK